MIQEQEMAVLSVVLVIGHQLKSNAVKEVLFLQNLWQMSQSHKIFHADLQCKFIHTFYTYLVGTLKTMYLTLKNGAKFQNVLEGTYTITNDIVNDNPYWLQSDGLNALWYAKTGWGFGPKSILGAGYHDHIGLVLFSDDVVEDPTLVQNWKYWNGGSWVQANNGDVNLQSGE